MTELGTGALEISSMDERLIEEKGQYCEWCERTVSQRLVHFSGSGEILKVEVLV